MLSKDELKNYIKLYQNFEKYICDLADLRVNIWEETSVGLMRDGFVELLCRACDIEPGQGDFNVLEDYVYNGVPYNRGDIDELYDKLLEVKNEEG